MTNHAPNIVVVLDDQPFIAIGMAQDLVQMGAEEARAFGSAEDLSDFLRQAKPAFALLDFKLGYGKTSKDIALKLLDAHVPVAFATGYGEVPDTDPRLEKVPSFFKPLQREKVREYLETINVIQPSRMALAG